MRAVRVIGPGRFEVVDAPDPVPGDAELLVGMSCASICGSDLHVAYGLDPTGFPLPPGRPGHEGVGRVLESRSGLFSPGDLVLAVPPASAGAGFAELQVLHERFALSLPAGLSPERALMGQQLGTVVFGFRRYWPTGTVRSGGAAGIIGAGSAGLFAVQLARRIGFEEIVVADLEPSRLALARRFGATTTVHVPGRSFAAAALERTGGRGLDLVVEAAGRDSCREACIEAVAYGGRVGFFGLPEGPGPAPFPIAEAFKKGCSLEMAGFAQHETDLSSFREALQLIASDQVDVAAMTKDRYELDRVQEAMDAAHDRRSVKVSLDLLGGPGFVVPNERPVVHYLADAPSAFAEPVA